MSDAPIIQPITMCIGDLELRSCDENLLQRKALVTLEIIRWNKQDKGTDYCFVVAMWRHDREGYYNLEFIGDRPFDVDRKTFWALARFGQEYLGEQGAADE
jgi:hypothetical protein